MKNLKQIDASLQNFFLQNSSRSFFLIKSKSGNNLAETNVIKATKQLTNHLRGKPSKVTELRTGELLVEVAMKTKAKL